MFPRQSLSPPLHWTSIGTPLQQQCPIGTWNWLNVCPGQRLPSASHWNIRWGRTYIGSHIVSYLSQMPQGRLHWCYTVTILWLYFWVILSKRRLFVFQVAKSSLHRPAIVLRLSQLQVLDGVMVTLEEKTRAELLNAEPTVRHTQHESPLRHILYILWGHTTICNIPLLLKYRYFKRAK